MTLNSMQPVQFHSVQSPWMLNQFNPLQSDSVQFKSSWFNSHQFNEISWSWRDPITQGWGTRTKKNSNTGMFRSQCKFHASQIFISIETYWFTQAFQMTPSHPLLINWISLDSWDCRDSASSAELAMGIAEHPGELSWIRPDQINSN